ncbi:hypothetical protein NDU88_006477 [Pleurodeles waltl]|uniref:Uncharacterized protein n=1 Tax=Pleurodeles waltl TaxID=8319 RepID=A0AAV7NT72_PLEWA|nr:hypothetical protein NDU88_006477 [Pleurodeles waltl]
MVDPVVPPLQATLDKILGAIEDTKVTLQLDIGKVSVEVSLLRADHQKSADRVQEAETALVELSLAQREPGTPDEAWQWLEMHKAGGVPTTDRSEQGTGCQGDSEASPD